MDFTIIEVNNSNLKTRFIKSQWKFYKNDPNFVAPVVFERKMLLNTNKNPFFKHSKIKLFLAENKGEIIGRIAAIVNYNHNETHNDKVGFFGFFECIDNQKVANSLFKSASLYLKEMGMKSIRGPVNPSMNDECGLLIEGFDLPAVTLMTYNPPYYAKLIENSGLAKVKDLYAYHLVNKQYVSEKLARLQKIVRERYKITIREVNFKNKAQFKIDVTTLKDIYNKAWEPNWGFVKMTDEEFDFLADGLKQVADPRYAFILEIEGKVAGFALALPDINQCLIHNKNGSLLGAAWHIITKKSKIDTLRIIVLGVLPEFRNTGADAVMYWEMGNRGLDKGIKYGEASWILEDNEMMNRGLTTTMQGKVYKKYRMYEKELE